MIHPLADPASYGGDPADAFDVIVPSLAGFGFSTPTAGDMNHWKMAELWNTLMTDVLGYPRYAAGGSDYGALVTAQLGHKYARNLYGIHLGADLPPNMFNGDTYWSLGEVHESVTGDMRRELVSFFETYASHVAVHMLDAQTLTHGLNDSPAGLLAWILQRWRKWSPADPGPASRAPLRQHAHAVFAVLTGIPVLFRGRNDTALTPWLGSVPPWNHQAWKPGLPLTRSRTESPR